MAQTLEEFLVSVKYNIDAPSQQTFFDAMKRAATSVAGVAGEMTGLGLAVMKLTDKMAQSGEKLYWMSQRLGDSVSDIQGMAFAMSNLGVSAGEATNSIERFGAWTRNMGPAATQWLRSLNVTAKDTVGQMRELGAYFRQTGGTAAQQGTLEYALSLRRAQMMGIDERTMLALSSGQLEEQMRQGGIIQRLVWGKDWQTGPQRFADQSVKVMNQFRIMGFFFQNLEQQFGLSLFNVMEPELRKINELLQHMLPYIQDFLQHVISYVPAVMHYLEGAIKGFEAFIRLLTFGMETFDKLPKAFEVALGAILALPSALKLMGSPIFWLLAGMTALLLLLDDYQHWQKDQEDKTGKTKTSHFDWGTVDKFIKPIAEAYKAVGEWMDKVLPIKGVLDMLAGGAVGAGILAITGNLSGLLAKLVEIGAFLMFNPVGVAVMAAMGLLDVAVFGTRGTDIVNKRAKELGYKIEGEGTAAPTYTKDGKTLSYLEMQKEEGFGEEGVTFGQAHGFRALPWEPGYKKPGDPAIKDWTRPGGSGPGIIGPGYTPPGEDPQHPSPGSLVYGQAGGRGTQVAGDYWPQFGGDDADRVFLMLRDAFGENNRTLSDILDTLTDMAEGMDAPKTSRGGSQFGGGGGSDVLGPGSRGTGPGSTIGDRNFNPMNLTALPGQAHEGRFRTFGNWIEGVAGNVANLYRYQSKYGLRTLRGIIMRWAPPADKNDTEGYIRKVAATVGVDPDAPIDLAANPGLTERIVHAMTRIELGHDIPDEFVKAGVQRANEAPGLDHQPLGADAGSSVGAGEFLRRRHEQMNQTNNTHISVVAPNPASAAAQVADHQIRVAEYHTRAMRGRFKA